MKRPIILVTDDEPGTRHNIINFLGNRYDCELIEASDGDVAMEFVKTNHCDLIILDIKMPKKSGMKVIEEAKAVNPEIDILIVSAYISDDVADQAFALGATDYVVKPIDMKAMTLKISNILERRGQKISKT
jgi:two-component system NtrC family response regulator